jgi:hypothetical protein
MEFLTIAQKKGIIPIVQEQLSKEDPVSYQQMIKSNQKFEFDLFSLPDTTCQRLEQYVNECMQQNRRGNLQNNRNQNGMGETEYANNQDTNYMNGNDDGNYPEQVIYYNLEDENEPYKGDKHKLIQKIGQLDNN